MTESLSELEKLRRAAQLIEEMSRGRLQVCPSVAGYVYVHPRDDANIGLDLRLKAIPTQERHQITFRAHLRRMGAEMDAEGLRALLTEVGQTYALLAALEGQKLRPSSDDLMDFREELIDQQEQDRESALNLHV